jgi:hypothetical protein
MDGHTLIPSPPDDEFADLDIQDDDQTFEAASPNTMMVDAPEEHVVEANLAEAEDVAIINPDGMETTTPPVTDRMLAICSLVSASRADSSCRRGHEAACASALG